MLLPSRPLYVVLGAMVSFPYKSEQVGGTGPSVSVNSRAPRSLAEEHHLPPETNGSEKHSEGTDRRDVAHTPQ